MPDSATTSAARATRGLSPVLLVLAALCFLLPFVGVSCNASALDGLVNSVPAANASQANECLTAVSHTDLYSYSGVNLVTGSAPSSATVPAACSSATGSNSTSSESPTVRAQPLLIVVLVLIVLGIAATALRSPRRYMVAAAAALLAAVLVVVNNSVVHSAVSDRITALANKSGGSSSFSPSGGVGSFFDIHPSIGFALILVALFLAAAVNVFGLLTGTGLRLARAPAGAAPPPGQEWRPDPPPGSAGAPAPEPPPAPPGPG
jgi:hypothetical protein